MITGNRTLDRGREGGRCYNNIRNEGENVWFELRSKDDVGSNNSSPCHWKAAQSKQA